MKVYFYDFETKKYIGEGKALNNPQNPTCPHIQANATTKKVPKCSEFEVAYYLKEADDWEIKPCYWGKKAVCLETKAVETVFYEGDLKEGWIYICDKTADLIQKNPDRFKIEDNQVVEKTDEEFEAERALREKERIAKLNLTAADVERAIYKAKGLDFEDILKLVESNPDIDLKALKIELKANNFYRGNPYISRIGELLGFSEGQLDEFFEGGDYMKLVDRGNNNA